MRARSRLYIRTFACVLGVGCHIGVLATTAASLDSDPRIWIAETVVDLGTIAHTSEIDHQIAIRNDGRSPLSVEVVATNCGCVLGEFDNTEILPGQQTMLTITLSKDKPNARVVLGTNDPLTPRVSIEINATFSKSIEVEPATMLFKECDPGKPSAREVLVSCAVSKAGRVPRVLTYSMEDAPGLTVESVGEEREESMARCRYRVSLNPLEMRCSGRYNLRLTTDAEDRPEIIVPVIVDYAYPLSVEPRMSVLQAGESKAASVRLDGSLGERTIGSVRPLDPRLEALLMPKGSEESLPQVKLSLATGYEAPGFRGVVLVLDNAGVALAEIPVLVLGPRVISK